MEIDGKFTWKVDKKRHNSSLLPQDIRGLIVGSSNCGKTTLILNLLLKPGWLDYDHLFVFGRSLHQKEYLILKKGFQSGLSKEQVSNLFHNQAEINSPSELIDEYISAGGDKKGGIEAKFYSDCKNIPDPSTLNENDKNLMIFDDCLLEKQNKAQSYYTRGRHSNCDCFYISQNYFKLDRQTIRQNSNFIILFPQSDKNLDHIYRDHCTNISVEQFKAFCNLVWKNKYNFVTIDLTRRFDNGKYRENFNRFFNPSTMSFDEDVIKDYEDTIKKIREKNRKERTQGILKIEELNETYQPLINATKDQTNTLRDELRNLEIQPGMNALDFYFNQYKGKIDPYFGIQKHGDMYFLGDKQIFIKDNNIIVNGHKFNGSTGLWALIMENTPNIENIENEDFESYKELMQLTNALDKGLENRHANKTDKFHLLTQLFEEQKEQKGRGISFLPSDIDSLHDRLKVLLAEFNAGNRATRNEIVAIVDNLIKRKQMTKSEGKEIFNYLQNVDC